jgi:hypothetical protein
LANGAFSITDGDAMGKEIPDGADAPAAARLAADGDAAGFKPGTSTGGEVCAEGSCGSADRAMAEESFDAASDFHQAHCGPD